MIVVKFYLILVALAQGGPTPPPPANGPTPPGFQVPIDNGIWLLAIIAIVLAVVALRRKVSEAV